MLTLEYVFENWNHSEESDQYWIETASHGYINYLPDEDIFIVNEGTENEYEANIEEVASILSITIEDTNKQPTMDDMTILKARDAFNSNNKKSAFRLDKKFSYISGEMSERQKIEELVKNPNSELTFEKNRYWIWLEGNGTGISKLAAKYFEFIKEFNKTASVA